MNTKQDNISQNLPCPFCGSKNLAQGSEQVFCTDCACTGPILLLKGESVWNLWNKRTLGRSEFSTIEQKIVLALRAVAAKSAGGPAYWFTELANELERT